MRETMLGNAQILEIFRSPRSATSAGCRVTDGQPWNAAPMCGLIRDNVVIHEGKLFAAQALQG